MSQTGTQNPAALGGIETYFTAKYLREVPAEIGAALLAPDEAREAAAQFTNALLLRADAVDEDGPLVHGWAVYAAFLAGVKWQAEREG